MIHFLDGHESGIKEKIDNGLSDEKLTNKDGIKNLLGFLADIYKKDTISDAFDKYKEFTKLRRKQETGLQAFIAEWTMAYSKAKAVGCEMSDMVLAFLLLDAANLSGIERNLVLTGVDYVEGESKKNLLEQMQNALKKFVGRSVVGEEEKKEDSTLLTSENFEKVLLAKGWTKPSRDKKKKSGEGGRDRLRSSSLPEGALPISKGYKGKKNPLGSDYKVLKCFKCKCEHEERCECPYVFHLADKCPTKKGNKADLGLYMERNTPVFFTSDSTTQEFEEQSEEQLVLLADNLETLCLASKEEQ